MKIATQGINLPSYNPRDNGGVVEYIAPSWYIPQKYGPGKSLPSLTRMPDGKVIIDQFFRRNPTSGVMECFISVFSNTHHRNLEHIPENCPEEVKAIYRAPFQLRMLRARDTSFMREILKAEDAWDVYHGFEPFNRNAYAKYGFSFKGW